MAPFKPFKPDEQYVDEGFQEVLIRGLRRIIKEVSFTERRGFCTLFNRI